MRLHYPAPDAMFDASSYSWRSAGRWWSMLGGQRALLLQVADPRVAAGVVQHSNWEANPFARLVSTMDVMLCLSFGSAADAAAAEARMAQRHAPVVGETATGLAYSAADADTGAWVFATLIDSLVAAERCFVGRWDDHDRARLWEESSRLAERLHVSGHLPDTWSRFELWWAQRVGELQPDENSRRVAAAVIAPRIGPVPPRAWWPSAAIAIDMLPPDVREGLHLPALMPASVGFVLRAGEWGRRVTRLVPGVNPMIIGSDVRVRRGR